MPQLSDPHRGFWKPSAQTLYPSLLKGITVQVLTKKISRSLCGNTAHEGGASDNACLRKCGCCFLSVHRIDENHFSTEALLGNTLKASMAKTPWGWHFSLDFLNHTVTFIAHFFTTQYYILQYLTEEFCPPILKGSTNLPRSASRLFWLSGYFLVIFVWKPLSIVD